ICFLRHLAVKTSFSTHLLERAAFVIITIKKLDRAISNSNCPLISSFRSRDDPGRTAWDQSLTK
ncbi:MAG: hypothetical protein WBP64_01255, partial [Nitrososphaeraceae archaeon]